MTFDILWLFFGGVLGVALACAIPSAFALLRRVVELRGRMITPPAPQPQRERK